MTGTTTIDLDDHFTFFISKLTASGRYGSASEAVRAGLRLLEQEEAKYEALLDALDEGENSGESARSLDEIVADAKARRNAG